MSRLKIDQTWTLFLDRDGVINRRDFNGYITQPKDFLFVPETILALKRLTKQFYKTIIVTNQQGVGKGIMTLEQLENVHQFMLEELEKESIQIDHIFVAANLKGEPIDRRKPLPNMGLEAKELFQEIDFSKSLMVGDTDSDILFGKNLGMKTVLVKSEEVITLTPDIVVNNLLELTHEIDY